jgi:3',5'-nucleoside bisphosphate phosphatase
VIIDLHLHTTASDGELNPEALIRLAQKKKINALSVTDHDTVAALPEVRRLLQGTDIQWIPGIEISCHCRGEEIHILGYHLQYEDPDFLSFLDEQQSERRTRMQEMVARLNEHGVILRIEEVKTDPRKDSSPGRMHLALALVRSGYARNVKDAFRLYLSPGQPGHVPRRPLEAASVIQRILKNGGVPVLAHPGLIRDREILEDLARAGIRGVEAYHPVHKKREAAAFSEWGKQKGLIVTGGSDFHGRKDSRSSSLGRITAPPDALEKMDEMVRAIRRSS